MVNDGRKQGLLAFKREADFYHPHGYGIARPVHCHYVF